MSAETVERTKARTAVVVVHGMGEQLPMETLNRLVRSALPKTPDETSEEPYRHYYSRDASISDSFEARRYLAPGHADPPVYGQTEFFEYHWAYKMTGNRIGDFLPTALRLLIRRPRTVPSGLRGIWWCIWLAVGLGGALYLWFRPSGWLAAIIAILFIPGVRSALGFLRRKTGQVFTDSFVDVVRYLDRSPRSYEVRKSIRQGMVDLLQSLHDDLRYSRIILVAHSLGAYIAYDGIAALWPQMSKLHCGPVDRNADAKPLDGIDELNTTAQALSTHPVAEPLNEAQRTEFGAYRKAQVGVWKAVRKQGNPWLITDLITLGTPMYFADLLFTRSRDEFDDMIKTAELPICPPQNHNLMPQGPEPQGVNYVWSNQGRQVLSHAAPFAVVRWTNMFFEAEKGWSGDWFGGRLRPLFGKGILDIPIQGNLPHRRKPGIAHAKYFDFPDDPASDGVAKLLQQHLQLNLDLSDLLKTPKHDEKSRTTI